VKKNIPAGKVYFSPVIDCYDGLPVAWAIGTSQNAELVNTMLDEAIQTLQEDEHPNGSFRQRMPLQMARLDI
jgi:transposase InsO family protein